MQVPASYEDAIREEEKRIFETGKELALQIVEPHVTEITEPPNDESHRIAARVGIQLGKAAFALESGERVLMNSFLYIFTQYSESYPQPDDNYVVMKHAAVETFNGLGFKYVQVVLPED
jgi:hypothetical protein